MPETHSAPARHLTAFLEKGEPLRERGPQHSVSTKGLGPCASQPGGPFSSRTAVGRGVGRFWLAHAPVVCLATRRDCSSSRYPCGSTRIRKSGRSPPVAAAR